jgi:F-type H+-transporting ATPase subunit epsilon
MAVFLEAGVLVYRQEGSMGRIALSGGFCDVDEDRIVVLADTAEKAENIDILRAREAKERALQRLRSREETIDAARARAALERALARLKAAGAE